MDAYLKVIMMLSDVSKLVKTGKYGGARLYIPSHVVNDSQFPLRVGERVEVRIDIARNAVVISGISTDAISGIRAETRY